MRGEIKGDVTEKKHEGWIAIQSMSFEMDRPVDMTNVGSNQRPSVITGFQKINVTSHMGSASNLLADSVANGKVLNNVEIHIFRDGRGDSDNLEAFSIWKLKHVIIDRYSMRSYEGGGIPEETWTLAYNNIEHEYKHVLEDTGKLEEKNSFKWDLLKDANK